jgi:hypothetical protein
MSRLYVYGLTEGAAEAFAPLAAAPVGGHGVIYPVALLGCTAWVSDTEEATILQTRRFMLAHAKALEEAMGLATVLPVRFGTIVHRLEALEAVLAPQMAYVADAFARVAGKAEFGVRVRWVREAILRKLAAEEPALARRYAALKDKPAAATHFERIELGRLVGEMLESARDAAQRGLIETLQGYFNDIRVQPHEEDVQVLKAEVLLTPAQEGPLLDRLEALQHETPGLFEIQCVGPSPAYNFVRIRLDAALAEAA